MKRIEQYQCDFCNKIYGEPTAAINCECEHLGLSMEEYDEYKKLLIEESNAYQIVYFYRNTRTIQKCDDAVEKVLAFQNLHNIPAGMKVRI